MSLPAFFQSALHGRASAQALRVNLPDGRACDLTFGELDARASRLAAFFRGRGLRPRDRLAVYLGNRLEVIDLWLACTRLGVIMVPINVLYRGREIAHIVRDAAPAAVVTTRAQAAELPSDAAWWDVDELRRAAGSFAGSDAALPALADDDPAALVYTSGTTGASKGAVLTHGNFAANARALVAAWEISAADRYLAMLPLFHVHGLANGLHCWLAAGCHMHLVERFDSAGALELFESYRPTLFFGVPTMYVRMLEWPTERARAIGERMRLFVSGSAPLPAAVLDAFRERFGDVILERYGMTETLMNTSNPLHGERRAGTVGPALPHVNVRIVDAGGSDLTDGTAGELLVRGPHVCAGYWNRPDAWAAACRDGWFHTGDMGVRAPDGYITLNGRRTDLIISGGFNIYPREIEEMLLEQPGVREAAVVGAADAVRGEVPVAYVVADADVDLDAVAAALKRDLASFKQPRAFVRVEALPRTALGKVQKHLLPPWSAA